MGDIMKRNRRRMKKSAAILTAIVFIVTVPVSAVLVPDIGGDPIYTQKNDDFSGQTTDWALTVYSYVFDDTSSSLPGSLALDPGEMLFMYLLDCSDTKTVSLNYFSIGNPHLAPINTVAHEDGVVPSGYGGADRQDPFLTGHLLATSGAAMVYLYAFDPMDLLGCMLDPGEYSLVYYIAVVPDYTQVPATAAGGGVSDNGLLPGPVPEPATILLLGLGALALVRIRRR